MVKKIFLNSTLWVILLISFLSCTAFAGSLGANFALFGLKPVTSSYSYSSSTKKTDASESSGASADVYVQAGDYISTGIDMVVKNTDTGVIETNAKFVTQVRSYSISYKNVVNSMKALGARKHASSTRTVNVQGVWYP